MGCKRACKWVPLKFYTLGICDSLDAGLVEIWGVYFVKEGNFDEVMMEMSTFSCSAFANSAASSFVTHSRYATA